MIIGLLGGSFNPAHKGHLYISEEALKRLGLHHIWWLVTPGNPLKPEAEQRNFQDRFDSAKKMAKNPNIKVLNIEGKMGTRYSINTIARLKKLYPFHHFIWLMGADNLVNFHKWQKWQKIAESIDIAVFDRSDYFYKGIASIAGRKMAANRVTQAKILGRKGNRTKPKWYYVIIKKMEVSSSSIRKNLKKQPLAK